MASASEQVAEKVARRQKKLRPDGTEYSSDAAERMRQLQEDGKVGGKGSELAREHGKKGGRPRKIKASELVAEKAREEAELIWEGLRAGLVSDSAKSKRESALAILKIEDMVEKRREAEQQRREGMDKDEIIRMLVERLTGGSPAALAMREQMGELGVVDAEVIEEAEQLPRRGSD